MKTAKAHAPHPTIAPIAPIAPPARLAIVDDHELLARALAVALAERGVDVTVVIPTTAPEVLHQLVDSRPDIVLLDLALGPAGSGIPLIPEIRALGCEVVVVTAETSVAAWGACIEAGAAAVVPKHENFERLLDRVSRLAHGESAISRLERDDLLARLREHRVAEQARREPFQHLTQRETEVLAELIDGRSVDEIAERAFVSVTTVRSHVRSILSKLAVNSQLAAVALAVRCRWSPPGGANRARGEIE